MYDVQRDASFSILSLTDWANPISQIGRGVLNTSDQRRSRFFSEHSELEAYYPPGIQAMSNAQLSQLWSGEMPREALQTLSTAVRQYDSLYTDAEGNTNYPDSYDMFGFATGDDDPTVLNYNALGVMGAGVILASMAYEPLDLLLGGADSVAMLLNGNVLGATANAAITFVPGAWGQLRRVTGAGVDLAQNGLRRIPQYLDNLVRGTDRVPIYAGASSPPTYFPNAIVSHQTMAVGSETWFVDFNTGLPDHNLNQNYLPGNVIIDQTNFNGQRVTNPIHAPGIHGCVPASCAMIIDSINIQKEVNGIRGILSPSQGQYAQIDNFAGTIGYNTNTGTDIIDVPLGIFRSTYRPEMTTDIMSSNPSTRAIDILELSQNGPILLEISKDIEGVRLHAIVVDAVGPIDNSGILWVAVRDPAGYEYLVPLDDLAQRATRLGYYDQPITP